MVKPRLSTEEINDVTPNHVTGSNVCDGINNRTYDNVGYSGEVNSDSVMAEGQNLTLENPHNVGTLSTQRSRGVSTSAPEEDDVFDRMSTATFDPHMGAGLLPFEQHLSYPAQPYFDPTLAELAFLYPEYMSGFTSWFPYPMRAGFPGFDDAMTDDMMESPGGLMRYVECLQGGVLAVWGDETSSQFNSQFSTSGV